VYELFCAPDDDSEGHKRDAPETDGA
jgi:hypothetical protein